MILCPTCRLLLPLLQHTNKDREINEKEMGNEEKESEKSSCKSLHFSSCNSQVVVIIIIIIIIITVVVVVVVVIVVVVVVVVSAAAVANLALTRTI
jgi:flagellar basal body-associated protein FliL